LERLDALVGKANAIYERLPKEKREAFFELVVYPVRGSALANQMHLSDNLEQAKKAFEQIQSETKFYNESIAGGKWRYMVSSNPRNRPALRRPTAQSESVVASP